MSKSNTRVDVKILDKDYQVSCPESEQQALRDAALELHQRMSTVRNSGSIVGLERIAVMVALNLCYELRQTQANMHESTSCSAALNRISDKLEKALQKNPQ